MDKSINGQIINNKVYVKSNEVEHELNKQYRIRRYESIKRIIFNTTEYKPVPGDNRDCPGANH